MKLAIFGATGRTGLPLVRQALAKGYTVKALVRTPSKLTIEDPRLTVIQGDATNAADVERTVEGTDGVLSVLGHAKGSPDDVQTVATRAIVAAMKKHGVKRVVSLTGAGVSDPNDQPKVSDRVVKFMLKALSGKVLKDAENHAEVLRNSGLEWIVVRGPMLTDGEHTGVYKSTFVGKDSGMRVSRADVADFMLAQLDSDQWLHKAPMVSY